MDLFTLPAPPDSAMLINSLLAERRSLESDLVAARAEFHNAFNAVLQAPFTTGTTLALDMAAAGYRTANANLNANAGVLRTAGYSGEMLQSPVSGAVNAPIVTCCDPLSEKPLTLYHLSATKRVACIVPAPDRHEAIRTFARQMPRLNAELNPLDEAVTCEPVRLNQTDITPYQADDAGLGDGLTIGVIVERFVNAQNQPS